MDILTLQNFRCFASLRPIELRPLTVLVGENSTGKSSFLAGIRLAWDLAHGNRIEFNEEPFLLGAFDQIVHFRGGRGGRRESFEIGLETTSSARRRDRVRVAHHAEFLPSGSHPVIAKQTMRTGDYLLTANFPRDGEGLRFELRVSGRRRFARTLKKPDLPARMSPETPLDWSFAVYLLMHERELPMKDVEMVEQIMMASRMSGGQRPVAIAPVRTRPQRTYNPVSDSPLPEGEHIPMVLAKTFFEDKQRWASLKQALDRFGTASGLFSSFEIKPLGRHESDPFQLRVKMVQGPPSNLVDVGYGISQVLPILVDALMADRGNLYLLQQPEVHLHPRAQAELGSFLAELVATQAKRVVVETHSDHLIDRLRMDVRDKKSIKPSDISVLFFERQGVEVIVHPMEIDGAGNLLKAPRSYRRFFLDEERRLLGI